MRITNQKIKKYFTRVSFSVIVLIIAIITCEFISYYIMISKQFVIGKYQYTLLDNVSDYKKNNQPIQIELDPFCEFIHTPKQRLPYCYINNYRFRGENRELNVSSLKKIIITGGSTTFGLSLENDQQTFCFKLNELLKKKNKDYEVCNAGVISYLSYQEKAYILNHLIKYKPETIMCFTGWNDFFEIMHGHYPLIFNIFNTQVKASNYINTISKNYYKINNMFSPPYKRISYAIKEASATFSLLEYLKNEKENKKMINDMNPNKMKDRLEYAVVELTNNMIEIKKVADSVNAKFVVVLQPSIFQKKDLTTIEHNIVIDKQNNQKEVYLFFTKYYQEYIDKCMNKLKFNNIISFDSGEIFDIKNNNKNSIFLDMVHFSDYGHTLIANYLLETLIRINYIENEIRN